MKLREILERDRKQLAELPDGASKAAFIWDYYKIPLIAILAILSIFLIVFISNIGRKPASMYVVLLNNDSSLRECDESVFDRILAESEMDLRGRQTDINDKLAVGFADNEKADIETLQVLTALFTISDLDLYVADKQYFDYFVNDGGYCDLSMLVEKDLLAKADLYYVTDETERTYPAGIILHEGSILHEAGYYHDEVIMGVVSNANNMDVAIEFIRLMLSDRK